MYKDFDTGELWSKEELEEAYNQAWEVHEEFPTFEEYFEYQLDLGRQRVGGIIEE